MPAGRPIRRWRVSCGEGGGSWGNHGFPHVRRASLSLGVLVPRRRVASGGARHPGGGARLRGARAHGSRRRLRLPRVRARGEVRGHPPGHRRRSDPRRRLAHHAPVRERDGLREPLPHPHGRACGDATRGQGASRPPRARRPARDRRRAERGARLLLGVRARRSRAARPARHRPTCNRLRSRALLRRAPTPIRAGRHETACGAPRPRRAPPGRDGRDGERPCARTAADAAPGRARRDPLPHVPRRVRARAPREPRGGAPRARGDDRALRRDRPCGRRAHRPARRAARVRPHRGARLPVPGLRRRPRPGDPAARRGLRAGVRRALRRS